MGQERDQLPDSVYALAPSTNYSQDGVCFAARFSGLFRTADGGQTWHDAFASLALTAPLTTMAVALAPDFPADPTVFAGVAEGILRSIDGGTTWAPITLPYSPLVSSLVVSPAFAADGTVLAGTNEDGVFRSADRGHHWRAWNFGLLDLRVLCLTISPAYAVDNTLFVGTESGLYRSTNGGRAWREVGFSGEFAPVMSLALSPDFAHDGLVVAGTESHGLFCSSDRGRHWTNCASPGITGAVNAIVLARSSSQTPDMLLAAGTGLLRSRDGGHSWSQILASETTEGIIALAAPHGLAPGAVLLLGLDEGGVHPVLLER